MLVAVLCTAVHCCAPKAVALLGTMLLVSDQRLPGQVPYRDAAMPIAISQMHVESDSVQLSPTVCDTWNSAYSASS